MVLHTDCKSVDLGFDSLLTLFPRLKLGKHRVYIACHSEGGDKTKRDDIKGHSSVVRIANFKFVNACSIRAGLDHRGTKGMWCQW